jgi:hypothetical protein
MFSYIDFVIDHDCCFQRLVFGIMTLDRIRLFLHVNAKDYLALQYWAIETWILRYPYNYMFVAIPAVSGQLVLCILSSVSDPIE